MEIQSKVIGSTCAGIFLSILECGWGLEWNLKERIRDFENDQTYLAEIRV